MNPHGTFYFSGVTPHDWTAPQNDRLWQDGIKTLFDPCPPGWRVPKSGEGTESPWNAFGMNAYAAPFYYYINGVKQTAAGIPVFVEHPNNGRCYDPGNGMTTAWYPAPGFREIGIGGLFGELMYVGYSGFNWSSSVSGVNGLYLSLSSASLGPCSADNRGRSMPVRCLRE